MYNIFQQNLEKFPKILEGTLYLFTFALQTVYDQLRQSDAILQQPTTLVEGRRQDNK